MTESRLRSEPATVEAEISLLPFASLLLRRRRMIVTLSLLGMLVAVAANWRARNFVSTATFIPQGGDEIGTSAVAMAASQFGIRVPGTVGGWGPPLYVDLLGSRALLESIALDTVTVAEENGRRAMLMDLLDIDAPTKAERLHYAVRTLRKMVYVSEDKKITAVRLTVSTRWPSVSLAIAQKALRLVNQFNLERRKSQAAAERQFVETQAQKAEAALREAEERLQSFLQGNRALNVSSELAFQRDRLQRDVTLRQQVYTTLVQGREEAKIREVRDTPVITVLEVPALPVIGASRGTLLKGIVGGIGGSILGIVIAVVSQAMAKARQERSDESREFFALLDEATPRFLRRG